MKNNNLVTIDNKKLLNRIYKLDNEILRGREHSIKNMIQVAILRGTFDVRYEEITNNENYQNYDRRQVQSNENLIKDFKSYINFYHNLPHRRYETQLSIKYFIEIVQYFNESLAKELYHIAKVENIEIYTSAKQIKGVC
ncbi:hypothetical protein O0H59_12665 [Staphylococcus pseudintermedius]|nr:hypothetical protein [Staphylococcus pseudintermedius]